MSAAAVEVGAVLVEACDRCGQGPTVCGCRRWWAIFNERGEKAAGPFAIGAEAVRWAEAIARELGPGFVVAVWS